MSDGGKRQGGRALPPPPRGPPPPPPSRPRLEPVDREKVLFLHHFFLLIFFLSHFITLFRYQPSDMSVAAASVHQDRRSPLDGRLRRQRQRAQGRSPDLHLEGRYSPRTHRSCNCNFHSHSNRFSTQLPNFSLSASASASA